MFEHYSGKRLQLALRALKICVKLLSFICIIAEVLGQAMCSTNDIAYDVQIRVINQASLSNY
jgi:hypothetical protein